MDPQNYSARTDYRPPAGWYRRLNRIGVPLTSLGLAPRDAVTLEVRGRTTGKPRRIPILRRRCRGHDYLVSLAGESQWVRNVRAADGRAVLRRRRMQHVRLVELTPADRPEVIAEYMRAARHRSGEAASARRPASTSGSTPTRPPATSHVSPTTTRCSASSTSADPAA
jgi:deazaflavin-dependent oxidoreductase (nitroreductase family)